MRRFVTWLAIGLIAILAYSYGTKAGHRRYREIRAGIDAVWNDPRIRKARKKALKQALQRADQTAKSAAKRAKKIGR